jgi:outer membrane protein assembly factor BamB
MSESTTAAADSASKPDAPSNITATPSEARSLRPPIKLFIPTLVLVVYWVLTEASYQIEMGMSYRFVTRMIWLLSMLLYFLGWGFTRRHFTFGQRGIAFCMLVGGPICASVFGHRSIDGMAAAMIGLPIAMTLSIAWLWISRDRSVRSELLGIGFASAVVFTVIALLRWDGLDGRQRAELSWRWTLSPEERFLQRAEHQVVSPADDSQTTLVATSNDWTSFRGGEREGVVAGVQLGEWSTATPREIWRQRVGPGWSSMIAVGDYLFTQEQRGDKEAVVCYDVHSGKEVWVHIPVTGGDRFNEALSGTGPRATPTFHENRIYAYAAKGLLECLDAVTGKSNWSHLLFSEFNASVPQWGSATSPTIVDDKVVVFVGGKNDNSLLAFDHRTGELRWHAPGGPISYSSPQVMTIAGERQIVMHDTEGLNGIRIIDGTRLWKHSGPYEMLFEPMIQPHQIDQDRLLINWDSGLLCLQVRRVDDAWQTSEIWRSTKMKPSFNDVVIHEGYVYGLDDGILCCVDLAKGQRQWKRGRYGFGQLLMLPELNELLVLTERGEVVRVALDPKEHREIGQLKAIEGKTWNHPILVQGKLIVRNGEEMDCFEIAPAIAKNTTSNSSPRVESGL